MALNPAFQTQSSRRLPLAFGYVLGVGDRVLSTTTEDGTLYALYLLGEGEWDGFSLMALTDKNHLTDGNILGIPAIPPYATGILQYVHFHSGAYTVKGAGNQLTSQGPDQQYDQWFAGFPTVTPPQAFSGIAYVIFRAKVINIPIFKNVVGTPLPITPMAVWRSTRCRTFDAYGNVTGYGFTTNPAWHFVEAILRTKIKPQQPALAGLTDAEKACFNWPSIVETAARNDVQLPNGRQRFTGNYVFASDATLTNILETILRVSRSYQRIQGNQIYLIGDDPRASIFLMGANHVIPGTLKLGKKDISKSPNVFVPKYRDIDIPAVCQVVRVTSTEDPVLHASTRTFELTGFSPFLNQDIVTYGGSSDPTFDGSYGVIEPEPVPGGPLAYVPNQVAVVARAGGVFAGSATGGYLGTQDARFSQRAPTNVQHRSHQRMVARQAPGLAVQPRITPVQYDCGNSTFDQTNRLMKFERDSLLGVDTGASWTAPIAGTLTGYLESVDSAGRALIDVQPHDVITLDDWVTSEFTGDYKVQERTIIAPTADSLGEIQLQLVQYIRNAYTDVSDDPGQSYATVPSADLPFETLQVFNAAWVLQATPTARLNSSTGQLTVRIPDLSIQIQGHPTATLYPNASWTGLISGNPYVLYVDDPAGNGAGATFGFQAGTLPLAPDPVGRYPVLSGVFTANSFANIDLASGAAIFFSGTGHDSATLNLPSGAGANAANLAAWAAPQGFDIGPSAHWHFIQQCGADATGLLHLIYNDSAGATWNGPINYAGLTWGVGSSSTVTEIGACQVVELTLAGGEEICFVWGSVGPSAGIPIPSGYSLAQSIMLAFPISASDSGEPTLGIQCYVDSHGVAHHNYDSGQGTRWEGNSQPFFFGWKNNMGTVSRDGAWVKIPLSTGKFFCAAGFSVLDARRGGSQPSNYPSDSLTSILSGGKFPLPTGLTADTLQTICVPDSFDNSNSGNPAHGVNESLVDSNQNVLTSFRDGSGNEWYGSSAVFAILCDTPTP